LDCSGNSSSGLYADHTLNFSKKHQTVSTKESPIMADKHRQGNKGILEKEKIRRNG
jgi:hypothetical protein